MEQVFDLLMKGYGAPAGDYHSIADGEAELKALEQHPRKNREENRTYR